MSFRLTLLACWDLTSLSFLNYQSQGPSAGEVRHVLGSQHHDPACPCWSRAVPLPPSLPPLAES